jgi:hypothetical protein
MGLAPCKSWSCIGTSDQSLSKALLIHLRKPADARHTDKSVADYGFSWPCTAIKAVDEPLGHKKDEKGQGIMWHANVWLRRCGMPGIHDTWASDETERAKIPLQIISALGALGKARGDNASLICPRYNFEGMSAFDQSLVKGVQVGIDHEEIVTEDLENTSTTGASTRIRCPRCSRVVAPDHKSQKGLLDVRWDLLVSTGTEPTLMESSDMPSALGYSFARADAAKDADCMASEHRAEQQLTLARDSGANDALIAAASLFQCGVCQLDGLARFLRNSVDIAADSRQAVATGALITLKCASQVPEAISSDRVLRSIKTLEKAIWRGTGFPSLHEAAAQYMVDLSQTGRLSGVVLRDLGEPVCNTDPRLLTDMFWSHSLSGAAPADVRFQSIWAYEREALHRWGPSDPLQMSVAYLDLSAAVEEPLQIAASLCNAALWLREAKHDIETQSGNSHWARQHISTDADLLHSMNKSIDLAITQVVDTAYELALSLAPGPQLIALKLCSVAVPRHDVLSKQSPAHLKLLASTRQHPFWSPPLALVSDAVDLGTTAARLHTSYLLRMRTLDPDSMHEDPKLVAAAELSMYNAALAEGRSRDASSIRSSAMGAALRLRRRASSILGAFIDSSPCSQ